MVTLDFQSFRQNTYEYDKVHHTLEQEWLHRCERAAREEKKEKNSSGAGQGVALQMQLPSRVPDSRQRATTTRKENAFDYDSADSAAAPFPPCWCKTEEQVRSTSSVG